MNFKDFLNCGCFIAVPSLNKVWILSNFSFFEKNDDKQFAFYKNDFFLTEKYPWMKGEYHCEMSIDDFKNTINQFQSTKPEIKWNALKKNNYKLQFNSLLNEIKKGNLIKGVPFSSQDSGYKLNNENLVYLLNSLFNYEKSNNLYLYGLWDFKKNYGFMGASPELLFTQNEKLIETYALAGTINNNKISCAIDNKIIREHNLVIDGIKEDLAKFGDINVEETVLLKLEKFSHLKSSIQLNLKSDLSFKQILSAIHPTPALGAFPKNAGFHWLHEVENKIEKRYDYCSPFGICIDKNSSLCVGVIRCLEWKKQFLKISAGGGVIEESIFEDEWDEICMKIQSVKNYFNLL